MFFTQSTRPGGMAVAANSPLAKLGIFLILHFGFNLHTQRSFPGE